jgi:hypothetical protein
MPGLFSWCARQGALTWRKKKKGTDLFFLSEKKGKDLFACVKKK